MIRITITAWLAVTLTAGLAAAQPTRTLRISATVPPRPCAWPAPCQAEVTSQPTRVIVSAGEIRYLGTAPSVSREGDLLKIVF